MTVTHIPSARVYKYWATLSSACNSCAIAAGPNQANLRLTRVYRLVYRLIFVALSLPLSLLINSVCSQDVLEFSVSAPVVASSHSGIPFLVLPGCHAQADKWVKQLKSAAFCFVLFCFFLGNHIRNLQPGNVAISLLWLSFASVCGTCKCKLQTKPTRVILKHNHGSSPPESRVEATKRLQRQNDDTHSHSVAPPKRRRDAAESRCLNALFDVIKVRNRKHE